MTARLVPVLALVSGIALAQAPVSVRIDASRAVRTMRGGIGASWHAIDTPIRAHAGSAWGANPAPEDEARWQQLYSHADWLGLDWCRVEIEQRMYEPARGRFDWNNSEMRALYRILDWAEKRKIDVFLQQMWNNVEWNAFPELRKDASGIVHSAPYSMDDFAEGMGELVNHLVRTKGYKCIRWLAINNEPGWDWSWWQLPPGDKPMPITPGFAAVRKALDKRGLTLPLSGPDWTDCPELEPAKIDFDPYIGAYDIHSYLAKFDGGEQKGYPLSLAEKRLGDWARWAHERNKPFFLSEVGTMVFGWGKSDPGPGSYTSGLKDASIVVRGINAGADGFNRWSFTNRGDLDGQWQLVDTWDIAGGKLRDTFTPHANAYFLWGLLSRFTALHSEVLATSVEGGAVDGVPRVLAAALRSPRGQSTILVVNEAESAWQGSFELSGLPRKAVLYRYRMTPQQRDRTDVRLGPEEKFSVSPKSTSFRDMVPARSVTVYSTYRLKPDDPGAMSE
jgi:hypothetical protein